MLLGFTLIEGADTASIYEDDYCQLSKEVGTM
jgi:hypothetical protein